MVYQWVHPTFFLLHFCSRRVTELACQAPGVPPNINNILVLSARPFAHYSRIQTRPSAPPHIIAFMRCVPPLALLLGHIRVSSLGSAVMCCIPYILFFHLLRLCLPSPSLSACSYNAGCPACSCSLTHRVCLPATHLPIPPCVPAQVRNHCAVSAYRALTKGTSTRRCNVGRWRSSQRFNCDAPPQHGAGPPL